MAEAVIKSNGWRLGLGAGEFALVFAMFNELLRHECVGLLASRGLARLPEVIRAESLDHDWKRVFDLDPYLLEESDHVGLQELVARSIGRIREIGLAGGVPLAFYSSFPGARFEPPFSDGTNWRAVAWPFVQLIMVPMLRARLNSSMPLLKALGW